MNPRAALPALAWVLYRRGMLSAFLALPFLLVQEPKAPPAAPQEAPEPEFVSQVPS